jgi:phosphomannomutase/phosphoglucomutase
LLSSVGCEVIDLGIVSSPTAEYMVKKMKADGCIIISASHNPPEWNALKVVDGEGLSLSRERGEEIEKLLDGIPLAGWDEVGSITSYENATAEHIEAIMDLVDAGKIKNKKIVLDCGNGTASVIAPALFRKLGAEVLTLNSHLDGRFPGRGSEPTEANVGELKAMVKSSNAEAGIAWDADGDRVIFVDESGNYVIGDKVFALCILWKKEKGDIVTTVATSKAVEDIVQKTGHRTHYTRIGAPYLSEEMHRAGENAILGGEEVGGIIWPELSLAKDGFITGAKLAEALCEKPLSAWLEDVPAYQNVKIKIEADEEGKKEMVARVLDHAKENKLGFIDIDGVRINFEDSWVIVRPSGTEECIRVFAEARSEEEAQELVERYRKIASGK